MTHWLATTASGLRAIHERGRATLYEHEVSTDRATAVEKATRLASDGFPAAGMPIVIALTGGDGRTVALEDMRPEIAADGTMTFDYVNWRGERAMRTATGPYGLRFGTSRHHPQEQYLLSAIDLDRGQQREYALSDMIPL